MDSFREATLLEIFNYVEPDFLSFGEHHFTRYQKYTYVSREN